MSIMGNNFLKQVLDLGCMDGIGNEPLETVPKTVWFFVCTYARTISIILGEEGLYFLSDKHRGL